MPVPPVALFQSEVHSTLNASNSAAVKAERPNVKVGDKYTFDCTSGRQTFEQQNVITSVDESGINYASSGEPFKDDWQANPIKSGRFSYSDRRYLDFPLEVGKKWAFADKWTRASFPTSATGKAAVVSYEKVRVPAGEFDAFKIEWTAAVQEGHWSATFEGENWYAPAARTVVKRHAYLVLEPELICELKEFELRP